MKINFDTKLFFSVSSNPGSFGAYLYNKVFQEMGINAIYKPLKLGGNEEGFQNFFEFVSALKKIKAAGLSISMPFKRLASLCAWHGSEEVNQTKNCNTMVFEYKEDGLGRSHCYNTDCFGFEKSCENILNKAKNAAIYGRGAVADSIAYVLKKRNIDFFMTKDAENLVNRGIDFLINATPVGMPGTEDNVFNKKIVKDYKFVFDVVVNKDTNLIKLATQFEKENVPGWKMSKYQLLEQYKLYIGQEYPEDLMNEGLKELGYE